MNWKTLAKSIMYKSFDKKYLPERPMGKNKDCFDSKLKETKSIFRKDLKN